ncbi:MAG: hypothetical protein O7G85_10275 [Planctomycetota bacterium]|nr:hypothetical protein [Planctomycetota bacterium]
MNTRRSMLFSSIVVMTLSGCAFHRTHHVNKGSRSVPGSHDRAVPPAPPSEAPQGKPPAHAKAHGLRRQWNYFYYPSHEVYYAPVRELYFWIEGDGWAVGVELPDRYILLVEDGVYLELDTDRPDDHHEMVKKKHKPKKREKGRGRG